MYKILKLWHGTHCVQNLQIVWNRNSNDAHVSQWRLKIDEKNMRKELKLKIYTQSNLFSCEPYNTEW